MHRAAKGRPLGPAKVVPDAELTVQALAESEPAMMACLSELRLRSHADDLHALSAQATLDVWAEAFTIRELLANIDGPGVRALIAE